MELQSIKKSLLVISVCICLFLAMTGCSADDGGFLKQQSQLPTMGPYPGTGNSVPLANAGADQYVHVGTIVTLNGNSSYDPDGNALTYSWHIDVQPAGSSASLSDASSVNPTFRVDRGGVYRISLVVSDGSQNSLPDSMNITTVNQTPVAHAGPDQSASIGNLVALDGSSSSDPDGDTLTYYWQLESPHASAAVLSDSHAVKPTFVPDVAGIYDCYLFVSDGTDSSSMDSVRVSVSLTAVADAGPDQYHTSGPSTLITLDGSGSYDSAGRSMTYSWSFLRKPDGSTATLSNVAVVSPTFTADLEGKYELSLQIMHDGYVNSQPDTVIVIVIANRPLNILPFNVNDAEYDKSMDRIIIVSSSPSNQLHIYDPAANQDQTIDLDAPPTSISVSPDGLYAAIGHNGFISYADLVSRSVVTTLQVNGTIADIVLGGNEYVYAFFQQNPFIAVNISTGVTATVSQRWDVKGKLHPSGAALYTLNAYCVNKYSILSGTPEYLYNSNNIPGRIYPVGSDLWITEDGTALMTQAGTVFSASSGITNDMIWSIAYLISQIQYATDSSSAAQRALIPIWTSLVNYTVDDTEIWIYDAAFTRTKFIALPHFVVSGSHYPGHGKFVFFNAAGSHLYAVLQADAAAAGLANSYGVVTY